jgi:hypothetical protein
MPPTDAGQLQALREAEAEVLRSREQLINAGLALRTELTQIVDWRTWYRRAPVLWLGGAFCIGCLLGRRS